MPVAERQCWDLSCDFYFVNSWRASSSPCFGDAHSGWQIKGRVRSNAQWTRRINSLYTFHFVNTQLHDRLNYKIITKTRYDTITKSPQHWLVVISWRNTDVHVNGEV